MFLETHQFDQAQANTLCELFAGRTRGFSGCLAFVSDPADAYQIRSILFRIEPGVGHGHDGVCLVQVLLDHRIQLLDTLGMLG